MEIILLEKVQNLGGLGDKVNVKPGYGRNFLIPQGKAVPATSENVSKFEARRAELEKAAAESLAEANTRLEKLMALSIEIASKAGDEGKLYGSIGTRDIAVAVTDAGVELGKNEVNLPEGPLRYTGEFEIGVSLHPDVAGTLKINVVAE